MRGQGQLTLTGQLGEVMQESARAALSLRAAPRRAARHRPGLLSRSTTSTSTCPRGRSRRTAPRRASRWRRRCSRRSSACRCAGRRDDRRDHAAREGAAGRRDQGEGAGGVPRRDPTRSSCPRRTRRTSRTSRRRSASRHGVPPRRATWTRSWSSRSRSSRHRRRSGRARRDRDEPMPVPRAAEGPVRTVGAAQSSPVKIDDVTLALASSSCRADHRGAPRAWAPAGGRCRPVERRQVELAQLRCSGARLARISPTPGEDPERQLLPGQRPFALRRPPGLRLRAGPKRSARSVGRSSSRATSSRSRAQAGGPAGRRPARPDASSTGRWSDWLAGARDAGRGRADQGGQAAGEAPRSASPWTPRRPSPSAATPVPGGVVAHAGDGVKEAWSAIAARIE